MSGSRRWLVLVVLIVLNANLPTVCENNVSAAVPEVVRVKVPASKVSSWFPKGTELTSLPIAEFDSLLRSAEANSSAKSPNLPIILRASHRARWVDRILQGETTLDVRRGTKDGSITLDPWNVVLDTAVAKEFQIRTGANGEISLWLPAEGSGQVTFRWRLAARAGSAGRSFALDLPRVAVSSMELDLPDMFVAERFVPRNRNEVTPPGHKRWTLPSAAGRVEIRLSAATEPGSVRSLPWISGPTVVDVTPLAANWRCDWTVDLNGSHQPLTLAFSEGLEPLDATGPGVASFSAGKTADGAATLTIHFDPALTNTTSIAVRGVAPLRVDRPWAVPAARPVDAAWTGGTTTVRLDRTHLLENCRVLQGRRLSPSTTDTTDIYTLLFEPERPEPPAELTFLKTPPLNRAEVRGFVYSSQGQTRLTAVIRWTLSRAEIDNIAFDLSRDWSLENITQEGEPLTWHTSILDAKTRRIHMLTPPRGNSDERFEVRVEAIRKTPPGTSEFELPRIRPVDFPVEDELWIASADGGRVLTPRVVNGVAWVDPAVVRSNNFHPEIPAGDLDHALAWRFSGTNAHLSASITAPPRETKSHINGSATLSNNRIAMDWRITIQPGSALATLVPIYLNREPGSPLDWSMIAGSKKVYRITPRQLTLEERLEAGFPREGGLAIGLLLPKENDSPGAATPVPIQLHATSDDTWPDSQAVPLLALGASFHARATLTLNVDQNLLPKIETHGLEVVEPPANTPGAADNARPASARTSHRFNYQGTDVAFTLSAVPVRGETAPIFVTTATLSSTIGDDGVATHRLMLNLITRAGATDPLTFVLPRGSRLTSTTVDGKSLPAAKSDGRLIVPLNVQSSSRSRVVILEYTTSGGEKLGAGSRLTPVMPQIDAACQAFTWRLALPASCRISRQGTAVFDDGLVALDSVVTLVTTGGLTGLVSGSIADAKSIQRLQDALLVEQATDPASPNLATWLSRIEAASTPLLVDATSLARAQLTPASPLPFHSETSWTERHGPTRFERGELVVIPVDSVWLVTTREASLGRIVLDSVASGRLRAEIQGAVADGNHPAGKFSHAHSWLTHGNIPEVNSHSIKSEVILRGNGWPADNFWCEVEPIHRGIYLSTIFAAVLGGLGLLIRSVRSNWIGRIAAWAVALALTLMGMNYYVPAWLILGVWMGSIGLVFACRPVRRTGGLDSLAGHSRSSGSARHRSARGVAPLVCMLGPIGVLAIATPLDAQALLKTNDVIIVLLPYEGVPRADVAPGHVILRLADLERLKTLASPPVVIALERVDALEARHQCNVTDPKLVRVTSEYLLISSGEGAVDWRFPSEGALNLRATLDDHELPIRMVDDGNSAVVSLNRRGRHRLVFERSLRLDEEADAEHLVIAVNPVAVTHIDVKKTSMYPIVDLEYPLARPDTITTEASADLGAIRTITVDFRVRPATARPRETFAALALWDARVAGDLVRFRLNPSGPSPVTRLRLAVEPGTQVRFNQSARLADQRWEGSAAKPEWVATFDPPFRRSEEIAVDVWKPLGARPEAGAATSSTRRSPPVALAGNSAFAGIMAFRRPSDWSGRLAATPGFEPIDEESFVKDWGVLPNDLLTLAGASGFGPIAALSVETAVMSPRFSTRPSLRVELGEGRVDAALETDLVKLHGRLTSFDLLVPTDFLLDEFKVDGLACLSRPEPIRLHVELHPLETESRKLSLKGHLVISTDSPLAEGRKYRANVPWIRWQGIEELPGQLTLSATVRPQLAAGTGVVPLTAVDQLAVGSQRPLYRGVFAVNRPTDVGAVVWQASTPNVKVRLLSRMIINNDSSQLDTSIRYAVSGGPIEVLYLKVPTPWSANFQIELLGEPTQRIAETRGEWTLWTIRPSRPIWGSARLILRASRPNQAGTPIRFPDVIPLGHGSVDRILAVERQISMPLEIEGSSGLQAVDLSRIADVDLFDINLERVEAYRVRGDNWGLSFLLRGDRAEKSSWAEPRLHESSFAITTSRDGASCGRARFAVEGQQGSLFRFVLDEPATVLAALVEGQLVRAWRETETAWCVPIDTAGDVFVDVFWSDPAKHDDLLNGEIPYPRPPNGDTPAIFRVVADPPCLIRGESGLEEIVAPLWMLERVERVGRRIVSRIGKLDRTSPAEESHLRGLLANFASDARAANESAAFLLSGKGDANASLVDSISGRLARTREVISESLVVNGFEDMNDALDLTKPIDSSDLTEGRDGFVRPPGRGLFSRPVYFRTTTGLAKPRRKVKRIDRVDLVPAIVLPSLGLAIGVASLFVSGWITRGLWRKSRLAGGGLIVALCVLAVFCPVPALFLLGMNLVGGPHVS